MQIYIYQIIGRDGRYRRKYVSPGTDLNKKRGDGNQFRFLRIISVARDK